MKKHLFYDELGNEVEFIIQASFSVNDVNYAAMLPADDPESLIYILRVQQDDHGDVSFSGIDDEELKIASEVYEELMKENLQ